MMERGLIWLPLLLSFIGLAWAGWSEYQKVQAYQAWAAQFDRAKYDIYAVLGQKDDLMSWGYPTRRGPINVQTFSLNTVKTIQLKINDQVVDWQKPPKKGRPVLEFIRPDQETINIPFTEIPLALKWGQVLQAQIAPEGSDERMKEEGEG